jgi:hydrogenase maturation factor
MRQVDKAAKQVGVAVVGGHTEVTPGLKRPIVVGYMVGVVPRNRFVTSSGAQPGDQLIMTKAVGIEGTAVLASDFAHKLRPTISGKLFRQAKSLRSKISVVKDALIAVQVGGVKAMHDPTEGGLLQGVWELAEASAVGFLVHESRIAIRPETKRICSVLKVDPLRLMSSGCLLIAADKRKSRLVLRRLRAHRIPASVIGMIVQRRRGRTLILLNGKAKEIRASERDELYRVIESYRTK